MARWTMRVLAAATLAGATALPSALRAQSAPAVPAPTVSAAKAPAPAPAATPRAALMPLVRPRVPAPKPFARLSESIRSIQDSVVAFTRRQLGVRYRYGSSSPDDGFDCSGLASYVMAHFGINLPRTSREQALVGERIERNVAALRPGDLLYFGHGRRISHVGIYIGGGRFVHAPNRNSEVREELLSNIRSGWWKGARRIVAMGDTSGTARDSSPAD